MELPLVDVAPLVRADADADDGPDARRDVARRLDQACRRFGFVRVTGHGIDPARRDELEALSRRFFELPDAAKSEIAMPLAGAAWRGWFPVGAELTSGRPDGKEGLYLGAEPRADDPHVLGDMLERMTKGLYRSTPHRVRNRADRGRLSFPFFLDPDWDAVVTPLPAPELDTTDVSAGPPRWDDADVHAWQGRYGDYLTAKVARVFPELFAATARR